MNTRRFSGCILLITAWTLSGCATHVPGGGPLRIGLFSRHEEDRSRALQRYCDADLYTYHQTCWRTAEFEPACSEPASGIECQELDSATIKKVVGGLAKAVAVDTPPAMSASSEKNIEIKTSISRNMGSKVAHEAKASAAARLRVKKYASHAKRNVPTEKSAIKIVSHEAKASAPAQLRVKKNASHVKRNAPTERSTIKKVSHEADFFSADATAHEPCGNNNRKTLSIRRGNIGLLPEVKDNDPAPGPTKPLTAIPEQKQRFRR